MWPFKRKSAAIARAEAALDHANAALRLAANRAVLIGIYESGRSVTFRFLRGTDLRDVTVIRTLDLDIKEISKWLLE